MRIFNANYYRTLKAVKYDLKDERVILLFFKF